MDNYQPNSHKFKKEQEEERKVEKVVRGVAKTKKKSGISKFAETFISDDVKNVKSFVVNDIIVPTIKDAILSTIDMALNGKSRRGGAKSSIGTKVSYGSFYDRRDDRSDALRAKPRFEYDSIVFDTRGDAQAVLDQMCEVIETYKFVTVADMYDMAGITEPYTSNKFGWTNLRGASVERGRDGYYLDLPKAYPID